MSELVKTKRAALELSILLWEGLAETGNRKQAQIELDWQLSGFMEYHSRCPLCEYTKKTTRNYTARCYLCPVNWTTSPMSMCQDKESPYFKWVYPPYGSAKIEAAEKVVKLLRQTLDELIDRTDNKE